MYSYLNRLKAKKGFTMVELIIVIVIIGILLALILPNLLGSDKPTKAKAYAKAYFYDVQDFMSRQRVAHDANAPALSPSVANYFFYTTVDKSGYVTESGMLTHGTLAMVDSVTFQSSGSAAATKELVSKFATDMKNSVTATDFPGTFYVVVDNNYVVRGAYFSDGLMPDLLSGNPDLDFEDDDTINGYFCCAYPTKLSTLGNSATTRMFVYY